VLVVDGGARWRVLAAHAGTWWWRAVVAALLGA
jgi:hypothetical protein